MRLGMWGMPGRLPCGDDMERFPRLAIANAVNLASEEIRK